MKITALCLVLALFGSLASACPTASRHKPHSEELAGEAARVMPILEDVASEEGGPAQAPLDTLLVPKPKPQKEKTADPAAPVG